MDRNIEEVLASHIDSNDSENAEVTKLNELQLAMIGGGIADVIGI